MFAFFSRSGDEILYTLQESADETAVFAKPADGFGQPHTVPAPEGFKVAQDRSADGRYLAVVRQAARRENRQYVALAKRRRGR